MDALVNKASAMALRSTPVVLLPRSQVAPWSELTEPTDSTSLSPKAQKVRPALREQGALFFDELIHEAHCCAANWRLRCRNWWAPAW